MGRAAPSPTLSPNVGATPLRTPPPQTQRSRLLNFPRNTKKRGAQLYYTSFYLFYFFSYTREGVKLAHHRVNPGGERGSIRSRHRKQNKDQPRTPIGRSAQNSATIRLGGAIHPMLSISLLLAIRRRDPAHMAATACCETTYYIYILTGGNTLIPC